MDLGQALLVPVLQVLGEELQLLRHPLQRPRVVLAQLRGWMGLGVEACGCGVMVSGGRKPTVCA